MADPVNNKKPLTHRLQQILANENLNVQRSLIKNMTTELKVSNLDCAAALLYLINADNEPVSSIPAKNITPLLKINEACRIKMVRYRLDIGSKHQLTLEKLKQVLIEESGVDKNNINNVSIRDLYTLIELPDAMPQDIFQHLKTVEINQQKLNIKRLKTRNNKKRNNNHFERKKKSKPTAV